MSPAFVKQRQTTNFGGEEGGVVADLSAEAKNGLTPISKLQRKSGEVDELVEKRAQ